MYAQDLCKYVVELVLMFFILKEYCLCVIYILVLSLFLLKKSSLNFVKKEKLILIKIFLFVQFRLYGHEMCPHFY